jgi:hypothetical protein
MFYTDEQKLIYTAPDARKFDPLAIYRKLILVSRAKINEHLANWRVVEINGDSTENQVIAAISEAELVRISRETFGLKNFADGEGDTDAAALHVLCDYLEWLSKKEKPE